MRPVRDFHHYRIDSLLPDDRVCQLERRVVDCLMQSPLQESERESSAAFELKHSSNVTQFARLLARKKRLNEEMCAAGAILHDIHVIINGTYHDHAKLGGPIARTFLGEAGFESSEAIETIIALVENHSDKHLYSKDPYVEFGKDVDVLDSFLYPNAIEYYLRHKTLQKMKHYLSRAKTVWKDLGLPITRDLQLLDGFEPGWLSVKKRIAPDTVEAQVKNAMSHSYGDTPILIALTNSPAIYSAPQLLGAYPFFAWGKRGTRVNDPSDNILDPQFDGLKKNLSLEANATHLLIWPSVGIYEGLNSSVARDCVKMTDLIG